MDSNGNLFFVLMDPIALVCWDSSLPYKSDNIKIVVQNDETLQFASGLKIVKNLFGVEELWVLTNRFQVWIVAILFRKYFFIWSFSTENYGRHD